jgi:hypothetical protein
MPRIRCVRDRGTGERDVARARSPVVFRNRAWIRRDRSKEGQP